MNSVGAGTSCNNLQRKAGKGVHNGLPEPVTSGRQSPPLRIGEPQAPSTQVRLQDTVLFLQVLDDLELLAVHQPANTTSRNRKGKGSIMRRV